MIWQFPSGLEWYYVSGWYGFWCNVCGDTALLARLNDNSFVVVNGLDIKEDLTCTWAFAYGYFTSYDKAYACFYNKVLKDFTEYAEVVTV